MDKVFLTIGPLEVKYYSVCLLIGVFLGIFLFLKESKKFHYETDTMFNLAFWTVIFGFLGARIYYVIFNWSIYASNPISILQIWEGGLAIHGGLIGGLLTIYCYCKKENLNFFKIIDMLIPSVFLGQMIGRWGNFFNGEAHGGLVAKDFLERIHVPNFVIEGMKINGNYYHPTFFYESIWCLLGFIIVMILRRFKKIKIGTQSCFYLAWYGLGRFFIEAMRTDSLMLGGFKVAQIVSVIALFIAVGGIIYLSRKGKYELLYYEHK